MWAGYTQASPSGPGIWHHHLLCAMGKVLSPCCAINTHIYLQAMDASLNLYAP